MKRHVNLMTVLMVVLFIAAVVGHLTGIPTPHTNKFYGFPSGG
jgi:hypothetical protein